MIRLKILLLMAITVALFATPSKAKVCPELIDLDTNVCVSYADQNLTLNPDWAEFYDAPTWDEEKYKGE